MVCILFREIMTLKNYSQQFLLLLKVNRKGTQKSHDLIHSIMKSKDVWGVGKKIRVDLNTVTNTTYLLTYITYYTFYNHRHIRKVQ